MNKVFHEFKDFHKGERVFLIANGPSLKDTNLDLLKGEHTIAMNRISLIYPENPDWKPTYYLFSSTNVRHPVWGADWTRSVREAVSHHETTSFIAEMFRPQIDPSFAFPGIKWFKSMSENKPATNGDILEYSFSTDVSQRIDKSGTTMNLALQLAYYMGFSEIIIVGADLGWTGDRGTKNDPNHFDSSYQADIPPEKVYKINNQMRNVHSLAHKNFFAKDNTVKFWNASKKTVLDIYPIIDFEDYILNDKINIREEDMNNAKAFWDRPPQYGGSNV